MRGAVSNKKTLKTGLCLSFYSFFSDVLSTCGTHREEEYETKEDHFDEDILVNAINAEEPQIPTTSHDFPDDASMKDCTTTFTLAEGEE